MEEQKGKLTSSYKSGSLESEQSKLISILQDNIKTLEEKIAGQSMELYRLQEMSQKKSGLNYDLLLQNQQLSQSQRLSELELNNSQLKNQLLILEQENKRYVSQISEYENQLKRSFQVPRESDLTLQLRVQEAERKNSEYQDKIRILAEEIGGLQLSVQSKDRSILRLSSELSARQPGLELAQLQKENQALREKVQDLKVHNDILVEQQKQVYTGKIQIENYIVETDDLKQKVGSLSQANQGLSSELKKREAEIRELTQQLNRMSDHIEGSQLLLASSGQPQPSVQLNTELMDEVRALKLDKQLLQENNSQLQQKLEDITEQYNRQLFAAKDLSVRMQSPPFSEELYELRTRYEQQS